MKAYKGFDRNMRCRGFQFEEGKTYEEDKAELCKTGFHACKSPLDVWDYYSPADGCEYHEVELEDVSAERNSNGSKVCGKRIRIGEKLGINGIVNAFVSMCIEKTKEVKDAQGALTDKGGYGAKIGSSGDWAKIGSSGYGAKIGSSGDWAQIGSFGEGAKIGSSGDWAKIGSFGEGAKIGSSGYGAKIGSSGDWAQIGSSGDWAHIGSSGYGAKIGSSGDWAQIGSSGEEAKIGSSGYGAKIGSSGDRAKIETRGENCVMMCAGQNCCAKGKIGSWIVLTEWINGIPNVVARRIDGTLIKADTWYVLRDGQLQEVETAWLVGMI